MALAIAAKDYKSNWCALWILCGQWGRQSEREMVKWNAITRRPRRRLHKKGGDVACAAKSNWNCTHCTQWHGTVVWCVRVRARARVGVRVLFIFLFKHSSSARPMKTRDPPIGQPLNWKSKFMAYCCIYARTPSYIQQSRFSSFLVISFFSNFVSFFRLFQMTKQHLFDNFEGKTSRWTIIVNIYSNSNAVYVVCAYGQPPVAFSHSFCHVHRPIT